MGITVDSLDARGGIAREDSKTLVSGTASFTVSTWVLKGERDLPKEDMPLVGDILRIGKKGEFYSRWGQWVPYKAFDHSDSILGSSSVSKGYVSRNACQMK